MTDSQIAEPPKAAPEPSTPQAPLMPTPPLEGVKMAVDFVKQLLTLSSGLIPFVSGGIFALRQNNIHIPRALYYAVAALFISILFGIVSFGSFIGQVDRDQLSTRVGNGPRLALAQNIFFIVALGCIVYGAVLSAPKLR